MPSFKHLTVNQLHKRLTALIADGHGRKAVCVAKETFSHNLESDGCTILNAYDCRVATIHVADDDGGTKTRKDGSECYMTVVILFGIGDDGILGNQS